MSSERPDPNLPQDPAIPGPKEPEELPPPPEPIEPPPDDGSDHPRPSRLLGDLAGAREVRHVHHLPLPGEGAGAAPGMLLEGGNPVNRRDPDNYFITIFGKPAAKGTWGYRIEGHHLAQNYTIVDGKVSDSPSFFGSNPAEVRIGPRKGLRVLALEDDYGYDVIESLDKAQQDVAVVDKTALKDIITGASRKAALNGAPMRAAFCCWRRASERRRSG